MMMTLTVYWYKLFYTGTSSCLDWILHWKGSQQYWLVNNDLHLNLSKSFFNPRSKPLEVLAEYITSISVAGSPVKLQSTIKNLSVHLDSKMSFDKHVSKTCKVSYFHIHASCTAMGLDYSLTASTALCSWSRVCMYHIVCIYSNCSSCACSLIQSFRLRDNLCCVYYIIVVI